MYAVVEIQGSQFKVSKSEKLFVNRTNKNIVAVKKIKAYSLKIVAKYFNNK